MKSFQPGDYPYSDPGRFITFTVPTLAKALKMDPSQIRRWIYANKILAEKQGGTWLIAIDPFFIPEIMKKRWEAAQERINTQ